MSDQPEALRLADDLVELDAQFSYSGLCGEAAAELRRLHAENEALQTTKHYEAPRGFVLNPDYLVPELQAERDALLAERDAAVKAITGHNNECQSLCGNGDSEASACGYRSYFEATGRRCSDCPTYHKIDWPQDAAIDAARGEKNG